MYGSDVLCRISKEYFEIPHKVSYPCIERCDFHTTLKFEELLDLRAHTHFLNIPLHSNTTYDMLTFHKDFFHNIFSPSRHQLLHQIIM